MKSSRTMPYRPRYREEQEKRGKLFVGYLEWFLALLILLGTGLAAIFINVSVKNSSTFAIIQKSYFPGFLVYVLINYALVFALVQCIVKFAPAAAASSISAIVGFLNGVAIHGIPLLRTLIGKIFATIGSVVGSYVLRRVPLPAHGVCSAYLLGEECSPKNCLYYVRSGNKKTVIVRAKSRRVHPIFYFIFDKQAVDRWANGH